MVVPSVPVGDGRNGRAAFKLAVHSFLPHTREVKKKIEMDTSNLISSKKIQYPRRACNTMSIGDTRFVRMRSHPACVKIGDTHEQHI